MTREPMPLTLRVGGLFMLCTSALLAWSAGNATCELLALVTGTPPDPLATQDWRGWIATAFTAAGVPFCLYLGARLTLGKYRPAPDTSASTVQRNSRIVMVCAGLTILAGLFGWWLASSATERLGWQSCEVRQGTWKFSKGILSRDCVAHGLKPKEKQRHKPPEERVISESAHGFGVLFGKPNPDYTLPGRLVDSPDFKVTLPEDRWEKMTLNRYGEVVPNEGKPSEAIGVDK